MPDFAEQFPLLGLVLKSRNLPFQAILTIPDVARIFEVSVRTIQDWVRDGKLSPRDLPGRGRFLPCDIEELLARRGGGAK